MASPTSHGPATSPLVRGRTRAGTHETARPADCLRELRHQETETPLPMTQQLAQRFRLVTRSDFDGLVCAALLKQLDMLEDILFVHPKDMQDGKIEIGPQDITTNLPYVASAHLVFDHHDSETLRVEGERDNYVINPDAKSASRVVYEYFGGKERFPLISDEDVLLVEVRGIGLVDGQDILDPKGWIFLSFLMDP